VLDSSWQVIEMPAVLDAAADRRNQSVWQRSAERHSALDLGRVRFIDSTGIGLLLSLRLHLRTAGRRLVLLEPSRVVRRALDKMRLREFFLIADSVEEAQRFFRRAPETPRTHVAP